ncbi:MAG: M23 family metallopeptidase [Actinomycetota bacterium]
MSLRTALLSVAGPFPVAGLTWWRDDWRDPRYTPYLHFHEGLDVFASAGTPLVAVADGQVTQLLQSYPSGLGVMITDAAGIRYFYAHLSGFASGLGVGQEVEVGDVIGYVGDTGNAYGGTPHLHFEIHVNGVPVPPKPYVDRWLHIAERRAIDLVAQTLQTRAPLDEFDFRLTRLFDLSGGGGVPGAQQLLLLAGLQPGLPSLEIAQQALGLMAWEIDWGRAANAQLVALVRRFHIGETRGRPAVGSAWKPFRSLVLAGKTSPRAGAG